MKASIKVQVNDRTKRLMEREYSSVDDLKATIKQSFEIQEPIQSIQLTYTDEKDELYIMDINDLWAAFESSKGQTLKVTAKIENFQIPQIESEEDEDPRIELDVDVSPDQFEELKQSINQISKEMNLGNEEESSDEEEDECMAENMEEEKEREEENQKFRDFRFADVFSKVEDVVNSNEKVKLRDIFKAVEDACIGTNAEKVARKFIRKFRKAHCGGPLKAVMKMLHKAGKKRHHKRNADEANMPRFGERHCQRWQNRCQKEEPCER